MLYLDKPEEGEETNFLNSQTSTYTSNVPSPGLGLIFDHTLEREGGTLFKGVKHALRADVMFRKINSEPTADERVSAFETEGGTDVSRPSGGRGPTDGAE